MILLPPLFGLIFILLLVFKLLGGAVSWVIVIVFGGLFIIPVIIFIGMWITHAWQNRKK